MLESSQKLIDSLIESSEEDTERLKRLRLVTESILSEANARFEHEQNELKDKIKIIIVEKEEVQKELSEQRNQCEEQLSALTLAKDAEIEKQAGEIEDFKSQLRKLAEEKEDLAEKLSSVSEDFKKELEELKELNGKALGDAESKISELQVKCDHLENEVQNLKAQNAGLKARIQKIKNEEEVSSSSSDDD